MLQEKLNELNLIELDENSPLYEFRYRINKYTNGLLQNTLTITDFDELLKDFDNIKQNLSNEDLEKAELIGQLKESIKDLI
jgi:hypothetical protein